MSGKDEAGRAGREQSMTSWRHWNVDFTWKPKPDVHTAPYLSLKGPGAERDVD